MVILAVPLFLVIPKMKISILDDPVADGLGLILQRMKLIQLITLLLYSYLWQSVSISNIGFVGLIAPHIAKTMVKEDYAKKLLMSAMIG
ncbi:iron chelate uptake ABC transporter family permease subunit [Staphylococcus aureus]